jgi:hypothetical protein
MTSTLIQVSLTAANFDIFDIDLAATRHPLWRPPYEDEPRMSAPSTANADVAGAAALAICEALLLALNDANVLPEREIMGILSDAAASHRHAPRGDGQEALHAAVAALIDAMIAGGNSVRRPVVPA